MIAFASPFVLAAFIVLPAIWWLLRLTPPRPQTETFPPLKILAQLIRKDETPHQSPWWLTLLRLMLASLLILALARPVLNPQAEAETGNGPQALLIDNSWVTVSDWNSRMTTARSLIEAADTRNASVYLAFSAMAENSDIGPFDAATALEKLGTAAPEPVPGDRAGALQRLTSSLRQNLGQSGSQTATASLAILSDGLAQEAFAAGEGLFSDVAFYSPANRTALALIGSVNGAETLDVTAARDPSRTNGETFTLNAFDSRARPVGTAALVFAAGEEIATAKFELPFEVRNDIATVSVEGLATAGATQLYDAGSGRRRVGLISAANNDGAQPLLDPLYYIRQALAPFADLVEPDGDDLDAVMIAVMDDRPSVVILADIGVIGPQARLKLEQWVKNGGTLIRFAGPRLAAAEPVANDLLLPVVLRTGARNLDGVLSWSEPQPIAGFLETGPFAGLPAPRDVTVRRQVLADPALISQERVWAGLKDGTPLVTGARLERGMVALFHVSPDATWSSLPISGSFVEMLRRVVQLAASSPANTQTAASALPPLRTLSAEGRLIQPPATAEPADPKAAVSFQNPPGLYGVSDAFFARNLFNQETRFAPFALGDDWKNVTRAAYIDAEQRDLRGPLFGFALALIALDALAVLWMAGAFAHMRRRLTAAAVLIITVSIALAVPVYDVRAAEQIAEAEAIDAISQTRMAYVETGNAALDEVTKSGIEGLNMFIASRTALEPGAPKAVDPETDELAFYPVIYWPIDVGAAMPSPQALSKIDAYMKNGGTVLFDTRDQLLSGFDAASASPETLRLRDMLAGMNVPALEPVPADHVLTKAFYILQDFPGRYRGGPLWVEAGIQTQTDPARPVRALDGVTPIMITGNDMAAAWAADEFGEPLFATVPSDPDQRLYAYRTGVNIMMYVLTGNYKSDQVHVPALLERLGQ
jgi:hypothetical protein